MSLHSKSLAELSKGLKAGLFSSRELTQSFLDRIEKYQNTLNSFITITKELALKQADSADKALALQRKKSGTSTPSPLLGIPIAHKDILCTKNIKTSCASKMLDNFYPPYDATVVKRFAEAGMVMLGKTNLDEFAMGSCNITSYYGSVYNPWDKSYVPGGSSGGSAAALAAQLTPAATGTDTGGSIRQPSAFCGISGLKPTYGRVSRYGLIAFASSLDQCGVMAKSAEDLAYLFDSIAGFDPMDSTSLEKPFIPCLPEINQPLKGMSIGFIASQINELDDAMQKNIQDAIEVFRQLGAKMKPISIAYSDLSPAVYYIIASAECSSNLARFDGVSYGYRCKDPKSLDDLYCRTREEGFGKEVKRRIMLGTFALSSGFYDAYYLKAQKGRRLIAETYQKALQSVDLLIGPTTAGSAFKMEEDMISDPIKLYLSDKYTIPANLGGFPALSIPSGFCQNNMPIGLHLLGSHFSEAKLLRAAHQFQQKTNWHTRYPKMMEK